MKFHLVRAGLFAAALLATPAWAQIRQLATTADGAELYFSTSLPPRASESPQQSRIWRWTPDSGLTLFAERERDGGAVTNFYSLERPWVSADGGEVRYHAWQDCMVGMGCATATKARTVWWSRSLGQSVAEEQGAQVFSRDGRHWLVTGYPAFVHIGTMGTVAVPDGTRISRSPQIVSDAGRLLLTDTERVRLRLWSPEQETVLDVPDAVLGLAVTPDERYVLYEGRGEDGGRLVRALETATGTVRTLVANPASHEVDETPVSLTDDGRTALLLVRTAPDQPRAWIVLADALGGGAAWHTYLGEGFREAVISGDGRVIYAVAGSGRLFRFTEETREWTELIQRTPYITAVEGSPEPGSVNRLTGGGFAWETCEAAEIPLPLSLCGVTVEYLGKPGRILRVSPSELVFQSSWDAPSPLDLKTGTNPHEPIEYDFVSVETHEQGVFAMPRAARIRGLESWLPAARPPEDGDGRRLSWENPARPEQTFAVFLHGLGQVDPPVADGVPAPGSPAARVTGGFHAVLYLPAADGSNAQPVDLEVMAATLEPGEFGLYRVELRIPAVTNPGYCGDEVFDRLRINFEDRPHRRQPIQLEIPFRCR